MVECAAAGCLAGLSGAIGVLASAGGPVEVVAAPVEGVAVSGEGGSIFSGDLGTAIWTLVIFVVLLLVLGRWAWRPMLLALKKREAAIRDSLEEAAATQAEAEATLALYRGQLSAAQQESAAMIEQGRSEALALAENLKQKAEEEAAKLRAQAEHDIVVARDRALEQLTEQVGHLATELAGKIIEKELTVEGHERLLEESLKQLEKRGNP